MSLSDSLICFKHCCSSAIFCKKVPDKCPICNHVLSTFLSEPFVIPYPLANAKEHPCSIVVRPSVGNFLESYTSKDDLHIGITNSHGTVFEYDKCGLIRNDKVKWTDCAVIEFISESWISHWNDVLTHLCNECQWNSYNYNEASFNCFDFVITFLNNLKFPSVIFNKKEEMCKVLIMTKINNILKYASLYKNLKEKTFYIKK